MSPNSFEDCCGIRFPALDDFVGFQPGIAAGEIVAAQAEEFAFFEEIQQILVVAVVVGLDPGDGLLERAAANLRHGFVSGVIAHRAGRTERGPEHQQAKK